MAFWAVLVDLVALLGDYFDDLQKRFIRGYNRFGGILYEQLLLAVAADACSPAVGVAPCVFLVSMAEGGMWNHMVKWEPEPDPELFRLPHPSNVAEVAHYLDQIAARLRRSHCRMWLDGCRCLW